MCHRQIFRALHKRVQEITPSLHHKVGHVLLHRDQVVAEIIPLCHQMVAHVLVDHAPLAHLFVPANLVARAPVLVNALVLFPADAHFLLAMVEALEVAATMQEHQVEVVQVDLVAAQVADHQVPADPVELAAAVADPVDRGKPVAHLVVAAKVARPIANKSLDRKSTRLNSSH